MTQIMASSTNDEKDHVSSETELDAKKELEQESESECESESEIEEKRDGVEVPTQPNLRFETTSPSPLKRAALVVFTLFLFWLALAARKSLWANNGEARVIHASRYSKEHKFRPAASPIITETLRDGRVRVRGAAPSATPEPLPKPTPNPKKKKSTKKLKPRKGKAMADKGKKAKGK
ncbi:hypothetical protein H0H92_005226 [Tricholoma furcatifolium]|nr:hypothetical protein H0H92_005226 [Tricholoma furcatifolium]